MLVSVSGQRFTFPRQCACCNGDNPDTVLNASHSKTKGKRVIHTKTWSWDFPYCTACIEHVRAWSSASAFGCGAGILTFVVVLAIAGATNYTDIGVVAGLLLGVAGWIAALITLRNQARQKCSSSCTSPDAAVSYVNWYGTVHTFYIGSRTYAAMFMVANTKKLVNLTEEGRQLMEWALANVGPTRLAIDRSDDEITITVSTRDRSLPASPVETDDEQLVKILSKLESLKGASSRRAALDAALKTLRTDEGKQRLMVEASKIEARAVLDKVDALKTKSAKKRTILAAIAEMRDDSVPDELQIAQIHMLESALRDIESESSS